MSQWPAYAIGVPPYIYGFHSYTGNSSHLSHALASAVLVMGMRLSPTISLPTYTAAYATLYAQ